jgi:hypothetical protein
VRGAGRPLQRAERGAGRALVAHNRRVDQPPRGPAVRERHDGDALGVDEHVRRWASAMPLPAATQAWASTGSSPWPACMIGGRHPARCSELAAKRDTGRDRV